MQIELKGLVKSFKDKTAVDIDSLHIADGEMVGLVGNNGAGKTTLFRLMLDLLKADNGYVELTFATDDANPNDTLTVNPAMLEDWKQYTGAYIDSGFLIEFLTPEEYFDFIAKVSNISKEQLDTRLDKYAQFMGGEIMGQKKLIRDFSAGNKQKIGIVAALINQPQLLILDILKQLLTNYNSRHGATILLSSHNLQHTVEVSSRIVLLEHGKIIKDLPNTEGSADAELEDYFSV